MKTRSIIIIGIILIASVIVATDISQNKFEWNIVMQEDIHVPPNTEQDKSNEIIPSDTKVKETPPVWLCAYIGFNKYPPNLFADFLENPHNKDVTFLNFTDDDLKQIPEFYGLILESTQMMYPLNDRVKFTVSPEEHNVIKNHLKQREYFEFNKNGETMLHQIGERDAVGNYRTPSILIDGKLYGINGLKSHQVLSDMDVNMNIEYSGTLEEEKKRLVENTNHNRANLIYFEVNESDKTPLVKVLDAINQIHKSKDKIYMSEDVGDSIQDKTQNFFMKHNKMQFDNDESKYTHYFILNGILYESIFVIC